MGDGRQLDLTTILRGIRRLRLTPSIHIQCNTYDQTWIHTTTIMAHLASHHTHPPFPTDIPTAPLVSISLAKLESGNSEEESAFWDAARNLGFFYLDMTGSPLGEMVVGNAERLKGVMDQFMALPLDEKNRYLVNENEKFFGYRRKEYENAIQEVGESFNVRLFYALVVVPALLRLDLLQFE